jgi:hypothetical protein
LFFLSGLSRIACRTNPSLKENSNLKELVVGAVHHLSLFSKSVVNVGCADALLKLAEAVLGASGIDATDLGK